MGSVVQALLSQSAALTSLVGHLVQGGNADPLLDAQMPGASRGSRGALGRAKLQAELASKKGSFFAKVMQAAARRMDPTESCNAEPAELRQRGLSMAKYIERLGGYGQVRSVDQAMAGHMEACLDILSLLCLPGTGSSRQRLHGHRLLVDPSRGAACGDHEQQEPAGCWGRSRAFAPLADQSG